MMTYNNFTVRFLFFVLAIQLNVSISLAKNTNSHKKTEEESVLEKLAKPKFPKKIIAAIFNGDIVTVYGDQYKYDTPLKKKIFKKTKEYKEKQSSLRVFQNKVVNSVYYIEVDSFFKKPYDIKRGAFIGSLGTALLPGLENLSKVVEDLDFLTLPTFRAVYYGMNMQYLEVKVPEKLAIKIEENKYEYEVHITFRVTGIKEIKYTFNSVDLKKEVFNTKDVQVRIWDKKNKKYIK